MKLRSFGRCLIEGPLTRGCGGCEDYRGASRLAVNRLFWGPPRWRIAGTHTKTPQGGTVTWSPRQGQPGMSRLGGSQRKKPQTSFLLLNACWAPIASRPGSRQQASGHRVHRTAAGMSRARKGRLCPGGQMEDTGPCPTYQQSNQRALGSSCKLFLAQKSK